MTKVKFYVYLFLILAVCAYSGIERYKLQKEVLRLEYEAGGIILARDMALYRAAHPFKQECSP